MAVEALLFFAAMYGASLLWIGVNFREVIEGPLWPRALIFSLLTVLWFASMGLYTPRQRAGFWGVTLRIVLSMLAALVCLAVLFFAVPTLNLSRGVVGLTAVTTVLIAIGVRHLFWRLSYTEAMKRRVLIYGQYERMVALMRMRRRNDRAGFTVVGVVHAPGDPPLPMGERVLEAPDGLVKLCSDLNVDEVVVALQDRRRVLPVEELLECKLAGVSVVEFITFIERETGCIQLDMLTPSWMIFGPGLHKGTVRQFTSRAIDFLASGVLVLVASPIMLLAMLAIWLEDGRKGAPIFYRQERVGYAGRTFQLTKFRSMHVDAEVGGKPRWALKNDPRVTRVGSFMRISRIDELPQLLNVLRGQMSFVGPRPERPQFVRELEEQIPFYAYRHAVKPGMTGWAQLCYPYGSSIEDARRKLQYDLYYVKNNNLLLDLTILVQTVEVVFMGKGAR
ncbi:MAG: TIGR03013 family PEP-CTERM/XrtA system glycosyltransferase [Nevskiaceae bacterium]|nr:TIGR03013 family PEP-CTERM/XrtA system glycosyltransferase [Nevskiaceae bacterium]